jgi:hypothetical protein
MPVRLCNIWRNPTPHCSNKVQKGRKISNNSPAKKRSNHLQELKAATDRGAAARRSLKLPRSAMFRLQERARYSSGPIAGRDCIAPTNMMTRGSTTPAAMGAQPLSSVLRCKHYAAPMPHAQKCGVGPVQQLSCMLARWHEHGAQPLAAHSNRGRGQESLRLETNSGAGRGELCFAVGRLSMNVTPPGCSQGWCLWNTALNTSRVRGHTA